MLSGIVKKKLPRSPPPTDGSLKTGNCGRLYASVTEGGHGVLVVGGQGVL
jgi:hypothetical protein